MRDHDGALLVIVDPSEEANAMPAVYLHQRLSASEANGVTCEGCGYTYSNHPGLAWEKRRPMYSAIAMHAVDGFEDYLHWCQVCTDQSADGKVDGAHWFTGRYGNAPAHEVSKMMRHRKDRR